MGNATNWITDRIERNFGEVVGLDPQTRINNINQIDNAFGRHIELNLFNTVANNPARAARFLHIELAPDQKIVGAGSAHTVIQQGSEVLKVHRASVRYNEVGRHELSTEFTKQHHLLRRYVGSTILSQETNVTAHPFKRNQRAVVTTQEAIEFKDLGLFPAFREGLNRDALIEAETNFPGVSTALHDLAVSSKNLFEDTGLLVDTSGMRNIVIADRGDGNELTCIDGLPIATGKAHDIQRIIGQLDLLLEHTA